MKLLIANGCSHTAGSEIDIDDPRKSCFDKAWPRWVADHYKLEYNNIAQPGSGNEQIARSTILHILKLLKTTPASDLVVVICWSGFDRYEFWDSTDNRHKSFAFNTHSSPWTPPEPFASYIKYRSLVESQDYSNYKNLYYMLLLSEFLESHNIRYCFGNGLRSFDIQEGFKGHDNLKKEYFELLELYGENRIKKHLGFYFSPHTFTGYLRNVPRSPAGLGNHWGEDGQQKYADFLIQHIETHGGLAHLGEH